MTLMLHPNLIKKVIGVNLSSSSMFLFFGSRGYIEGGEATILDPVTLEAPAVMVDLIPTGLILTGIVVSVSITAFFLAITLRIYNRYGSMDLDEILGLININKNKRFQQ
ncbi:MAG: NADH-quinone oxidoreductase subunit K [Firmicutes bacterium]|nr:NADH-quinone oxidoreductase subunit K [Bacillota bacterium]